MVGYHSRINSDKAGFVHALSLPFPFQSLSHFSISDILNFGLLINNHDKNDRMKNGVQKIEPFIWAQKVPDDKYLEEEHE